MAKRPTQEQVLARKIRIQKSFLLKVIIFVEKLVQEHGRQTKYDQGSAHTHVVKELKSFARFNFETNLGQTVMGGNNITIWYLVDLEDPAYRLVLKVYWQVSPDECRVEQFDRYIYWQKTLKRVMANKDKILARMARAQQVVKEHREKNRTQKTNLEKLQAEAERLAIS